MKCSVGGNTVSCVQVSFTIKPSSKMQKSHSIANLHGEIKNGEVTEAAYVVF